MKDIKYFKTTFKKSFKQKTKTSLSSTPKNEETSGDEVIQNRNTKELLTSDGRQKSVENILSGNKDYQLSDKIALSKQNSAPVFSQPSLYKRDRFTKGCSLNKRASYPVVLTDGFSSATGGTSYRMTVNDVGIDDEVINIKNCPSKPNRTSADLNVNVFDEAVNLKKSKSENQINGHHSSQKRSAMLNPITRPPNKELPPPPVEEYSYAAMEYRPMELTDDGAISAPVDDKTKIIDTKPGSTYSYAHVSLRPMVIGKQTAVSLPVNENNLFTDQTTNNNITENSGNYISATNGDLYAVVDKNTYNTTPTVAQQSPQHIDTNGDLYAVVDKTQQTHKTNSNTCLNSYDTAISDQPSSTGQPELQDLYAAINYSDKRRPSAEDVLSQQFEPRQFSDLRIRNSRRVSDGLLETNYFGAGKRFPPAIPKPYAATDRKWELPPHPEESTSSISASTRQRLDSFNRNSISTEDMLSSSGYEQTDIRIRQPNHSTASTSASRYEPTDYQTKHLLPTDSIHLVNERLAKSQNSEELKQLRQFKKQHRRMRSHETIDRPFLQQNFQQTTQQQQQQQNTNNFQQHTSKHNSSSLLNNHAMNNHSSASSSSLSHSTSKDSEDDIFSDSPSLDEQQKHYMSPHDGDNMNDLPEGWQEVNDGDNDLYYWHIWTGTIQHERPTRSATPSTSSDHSRPSSRAPSVSDAIEEKNQKNITGQSTMASPRPETPDKLKQIISFPVHSMGWMDVDETLMGAKIIGDTVNNCIKTLAEDRHDLWKTSETWAEVGNKEDAPASCNIRAILHERKEKSLNAYVKVQGADIKLILEGETLKLFEPKSGTVLHTQPIAKMRVWGVGRVETRDFAYIARDQSTGKHRCHMFRCHGHVSGRSITNALQAICNRVLDEKRKAKERSETPTQRSSGLLKPPSKGSSPAFNEKPYVEQKKCFTAKYVGTMDLTKSSGIDLINKAVCKFVDEPTTNWSSVLVEVTTSEIKTVDCVKQQLLMEHRVRYISFLGVAQDERFGAYIVAVSKDTFQCHVFFCAPHAGTLTKAIEEACKLRFEKMLDGKSHLRNTTNNASNNNNENKTSQQQQQQTPTSQQMTSSPQQQHQQTNTLSRNVKEKTSKFLSASIAGVFNKLNKKDSKKKDEETTDSHHTLAPGPNEHLVKYYGSVNVDLGTGVDTVQTAVNNLVGGEMMVGYLEIQTDCITLWDSQRTALSKRIFDLNTISYCGMTSDRKHFGIIVSRGKGKYTCHVFQEYKEKDTSQGVDVKNQPNLGEIVHAIHEVL